MSNPFIVRPTLNSGEKTIQKSAKSKVSTLRKNISLSTNLHNRHISVKDSILTQALNYDTLLSYTKGYYLTQKDCDISSNRVCQVSDGLYSILDFSNNSLYDFSGQLILDDCKLEDDLIGLTNVERNPLFVERIFKFPKRLTISGIANCVDQTLNNTTNPTIHLADGVDDSHTHYFPNNLGILNYTHNHNTSNHPNYDTTSDPFPHSAVDYVTPQKPSDPNIE